MYPLVIEMQALNTPKSCLQILYVGCVSARGCSVVLRWHDSWTSLSTRGRDFTKCSLTWIQDQRTRGLGLTANYITVAWDSTSLCSSTWPEEIRTWQLINHAQRLVSNMKTNFLINRTFCKKYAVIIAQIIINSQIHTRTIASLDPVESYVTGPFCLDKIPSLAIVPEFLLRVGSDEDQLVGLPLPSSPPT